MEIENELPETTAASKFVVIDVSNSFDDNTAIITSALEVPKIGCIVRCVAVGREGDDSISVIFAHGVKLDGGKLVAI